MKTLKLIAIAVLSLIILENMTDAQVKSNAQTEKKTNLRKTFPHVSISPYGGAIFPLPKVLTQTFKPGGAVGLDVGYRINREVALYAKLGYYFMNSKITDAPIGQYLEFTAGPRYYFTHPKVKSTIFLEGGVGGYNFRQNGYLNPQDTTAGVVEKINDTRPGLNGGIGATLALSNVIDFMVKGKYNVIFTPNATSSFINVVGGVEFRFR